MFGSNEMNEIKGILTNTKQMLEKLERIQKTALSNMPPEHLPKISALTADYNKVMRSMKNGDVDAINKIMNKYAGTN